MNPSYYLEHYSFIPKEYEDLIAQGIDEHTMQVRHLSPVNPFSILIKDQSGQPQGGVCGVYFHGSLYIDLLWVAEPLRHQGWGTKLMQEAEKIAKEKKAYFITLNTMDWQALTFYQKLGFFIEFTREGYEQGSKMFLLRKNLSNSSG